MDDESTSTPTPGQGDQHFGDSRPESSGPKDTSAGAPSAAPSLSLSKKGQRAQNWRQKTKTKAQNAKDKIKNASQKVRNAAKKGKQAMKRGKQAVQAANRARQVGQLGATAAASGGTSLAVQAGLEVAKFGAQKLRQAFREGAVTALTSTVTSAWSKGQTYVKLVGGVFVFIIILIVAVVGTITGGSLDAASAAVANGGLVYNMVGPTQVGNSDQYVYTITIAYNDTAGDVLLLDTLPVGVVFVSASEKVSCDNGPCDSNSTKLQWSAVDNDLGGGPFSTSFTITVQAIATDIQVANIIQPVIIPVDR